MKKVNGLLIFIAIASIGVLAFVAVKLGVVSLSDNTVKNDNSSQKDVKSEYETDSGKNREINPAVIENLFLHKGAEEIYSYEFQKSVRNGIEELKSKNDYNENAPLLIINPFCTNSQVMYVYFETEVPYAVSYTVHTSATSSAAPDFGGYVDATDEVITRSNGSVAVVPNSKIHEFGINGLVPNEENIITIKLYDEYGDVRVRTFSYYFRDIKSKSEEAVTVEPGRKVDTDPETGEARYMNASDKTLSEGLYAVFCAPNDYASYLKIYDNDGFMRGEFPLEKPYATKVYAKDGELFLFVSDSKLVRMNNYGEVTKIFRSPEYSFGTDWCIDGNGNILMIASDNSSQFKNDIVISINFTDDEIYELIDMKKLFSEYADSKINPYWINLSSISYVGDNMIITASEKLKSVIKVRRIYNDPRLVYLAGDPGVLRFTQYNELFLRNEGNFAFSSTTQITGTAEYDLIKKARYYIWALDENLNYKYGKKEAHFGFYHMYLVDEDETTIRIARTTKLPEITETSRIVKTGDNWLMIRGDDSVFYEYDEDFNLIAYYTYRKPIVEYTVEEQDYFEDNPPPDDSVIYKDICKFDSFDYYFVKEPVVYRASN